MGSDNKENTPIPTSPLQGERRWGDEVVGELREVALEAGAAIMEIYESDFDVRSKDDRSPVTDADERAENIIVPRLAALTPDIPIVAEESVSAGNIPDVSGGTFWLVDPLDGTREFISRNGEFTVNIGLIENGVPTLGVVYVPVHRRLYTASGPGAAFVENDGGKPEPIAARAPAADGLVAVASRSHRDAQTNEFLGKLNIKDFTAAGSSLKFCLRINSPSYSVFVISKTHIKVRSILLLSITSLPFVVFRHRPKQKNLSLICSLYIFLVSAPFKSFSPSVV